MSNRKIANAILTELAAGLDPNGFAPIDAQGNAMAVFPWSSCIASIVKVLDAAKAETLELDTDGREYRVDLAVAYAQLAPLVAAAYAYHKHGKHDDLAAMLTEAAKVISLTSVTSALVDGTQSDVDERQSVKGFQHGSIDSPEVTREMSNSELAARIAAKIMTGARGHEASRLELRMAGEVVSRGGYNRQGLTGVIQRVLESAEAERLGALREKLQQAASELPPSEFLELSPSFRIVFPLANGFDFEIRVGRMVTQTEFEIMRNVLELARDSIVESQGPQPTKES